MLGPASICCCSLCAGVVLLTSQIVKRRVIVQFDISPPGEQPRREGENGRVDAFSQEDRSQLAGRHYCGVVFQSLKNQDTHIVISKNVIMLSLSKEQNSTAPSLKHFVFIVKSYQLLN